MKNLISNIKTESLELLEKTDDELQLKITQIKKEINKEGIDKGIAKWLL